ncbi:hypothetical protein CE91St58_22230 [Lachnospiraceae bacterium]|nr:hypothetical protein CE91St58_22230 [Lachnospiraceae bacterium]
MAATVIALVGVGYIKIVFQRVPATFRVEHRNAFAVFVYPTLKLLIPSFKLRYRNSVRALSVNQELLIKSALIVAAGRG